MKKHHLGAALLSAALATTLAAGTLLSAPAGASSSALFKVKELVNSSTYVKKLNQTVVVPTGKFIGTINTNTGALRGKLTLPPATSPVKIEGIGVAQATFVMAPTKPVTGRVNFKKFTITSHSTFNIDVTSLTPNGTSVNLVGNQCKTATPVTLTLTGPFQAIGSSTYTATYTIPPFANCLAMTPLLTEQVSGPDNGITATFAPA
jgi:hypothetical protein